MGAHPLFLPLEWDLLPYEEVLKQLLPIYLIGLTLFLCKDVVGGVSPGKGLLNLRVARVDEGFPQPSIAKLILRNFFIILLPIELFFLLMDKHCRRLGDKYMGTMVVERIRPAVVRHLTVKMMAVMLAFATLWMTFTFCTPFGIKRSSGYLITVESIRNSPDVFDQVGEIESIGYWPEVKYTKNKINYRLKVIGERGEKTVQVILESNISFDKLTTTPTVRNLRVLSEEQEEE